VIQAALGDEEVGERGSSAVFDQPGPQRPGSLPVAIRHGEQRDLPEERRDPLGQAGTAQKLGQDHRWQACLPAAEGRVDDRDVRAGRSR
jgi:hypothetical protein